MCDSVSDMGGGSYGGYNGLGIGNPGSYGGSNTLDSSSHGTGTQRSTGGDSHRSSNSGTSNSGQNESQAGNNVPGISSPGTHCSVSDLYGGTRPKTTSSEEEKEEEATKAELDRKERARLGDKAYREQVTTNASPATHLDSYSRGLSVSGGPPPGVAAPPQVQEAINDTIKNLLDNASNFCPGPNTTIINRDLLNNFLDDYNRSTPDDT